MVGHARPASRRTAMGGWLTVSYVLGILTYRNHCFLSSPTTLMFLLLLCCLPSSPLFFLPFASLPHLSSSLVDYLAKFPPLFRLRIHAFPIGFVGVLRVYNIPSQSKFFNQLWFFCSNSEFPVCIPWFRELTFSFTKSDSRSCSLIPVIGSILLSHLNGGGTDFSP